MGGRGVWVKKGQRFWTFDQIKSVWTSKTFTTQKIHSTNTYVGETMSSYASQQNLGLDKVYFWKVSFDGYTL